MIERDPVLSALAALPASTPSAELSARVRRAGQARLRPRALHPFFTIAVVGSVASYLSWAFVFTSSLH